MKYWDRIEVHHNRTIVEKHERVLQGKYKRVTTPGHHRLLIRRNAHQGPSAEEKALSGQSELLDIAEVVHIYLNP